MQATHVAQRQKPPDFVLAGRLTCIYCACALVLAPFITIDAGSC